MIYFSRHGETIFNKEGRLQGISDSPLTDVGIEQAKFLKEFSMEKGITRCVSSPLPRVVETAKIVGIPYSLENRLREICYGSWEEKCKSELRKLDLCKEREREKFTFKHPGQFKGIEGESYEDLFNRLKVFMAYLSEVEAESNLLVLSHLGVLRCVYKYFNNLTNEEAGKLEFLNNTILVLDKGRIYEYI